MKKINLVVIGYGGMGSWHTRFAKDSDCVNLAGVYDIKEEKNEAARKNGILPTIALKRCWQTRTWIC